MNISSNHAINYLDIPNKEIMKFHSFRNLFLSQF
jgi:hypothetical protein